MISFTQAWLVKILLVLFAGRPVLSGSEGLRRLYQSVSSRDDLAGLHSSLHSGETNRSRAEDDNDPLAQWLYGLKLHLGDVEETKFRMSFHAKNFVCERMSIQRVLSSTTMGSLPSFSLNLQGLGITCRASWSLPLMKGDLLAEVKPAASASLAVSLPVDNATVPQRAELSECDAKLNFSLKLGKNIAGYLLDWIIPLVQGKIKSQAVKKICGQLRVIVASNLTQGITDLNKIMVPIMQNSSSAAINSSRTRFIPQSIPYEDEQSVDWTKVGALKWQTWIINDLLGANGIDEALKWALNGTGRVEVQGSKEPIVNSSVSINSSQLDISLRLQKLTVEGIDGVKQFDAITPASPMDLKAGIALGTPRQPAISASADLVLSLEASDPADPTVAPSHIDESINIAVGLEGPSIGGRLRLLLGQDRLSIPRTIAQLLFGAKGCAKDLLLASPELQEFSLNFLGVSEPLTFASSSQGNLSADLMMLADRAVELFNDFYLQYLPHALSRLAASQTFITEANAMISSIAKPTPAGRMACLSKDEAAKRAASFPLYADWRKLLGGNVRTAIDNIADGFLSHNSTKIKHVAEIPALEVKTDQIRLALQPKELDFDGLSQIEFLRAFLPHPSDSRALSCNVSISCPIASRSWQPVISMHENLIVPSKDVNWDLAQDVAMPCGDIGISLRAALNLHEAMALVFPPPAACLAAPFESIFIDGVSGTMRWIGSVVIQKNQVVEHPVSELCASYPRLCDRIENVARSGKLLHAGNTALTKLLLTSKKECLASEESAPQDADGATGSEAAIGPWVASIAAAIAVAAAFVMLPVMMAGRRSTLSNLPLASKYWSSDKTSTRIRMASVSALLGVALVLRTVSLFFMDTAYSYNILEMDGIGRIVDVNLITFTFFGMVEHYWAAGAYISSLLLLLNSFIVAYGVILMCLVVWLVPALAKQRVPLLRIAMFLSRLPFVDVVFFGHVIPVLNSDVSLPMGLTAKIRSDAKGGIYVGIASATCAILAAQGIWSLLPQQRASPASQSPWEMRLKAASSIAIIIGLALWMLAQYFSVTFTQLAGDVLGSTSFTASSLLAATFRGNAFIASVVLGMAVLAPLAQAVSLLVSALGRRLETLLKLGDALAILDVFTAGFLAIVLEIDSIAQWIVENKFGSLCDAIQAGIGTKCIGVEPQIGIGGFLGLLLALFGSCGCALATLVGDIRASRDISEADTDPIQD